ncbi:unnamed protein product [Arabis nemorensis]|uniref:Uncharacterized protein n=1 Tax=Arabis nemorensis TaxID=586526 RepID=A0A565BN04_9BRAS|nr:unnamed protein product [Arabis nemorensis]
MLWFLDPKYFDHHCCHNSEFQSVRPDATVRSHKIHCVVLDLRKKALIEDFAEYSVVVINGYLPSCGTRKWCTRSLTGYGTTFSPYKVEGVFFPLVLAQESTSQTAKKKQPLSYRSLTPNDQNVFKILAEYQLSHPDEDSMPTDNLYSASRERFFVSSQVTLNSLC